MARCNLLVACCPQSLCMSAAGIPQALMSWGGNALGDLHWCEQLRQASCEEVV